MFKQRDFTVIVYTELIQVLQESGYSFFTFEDYCLGKATGKFIILRHDVDLRAVNSLYVAEIEHNLGIRSTYYFRVVPESNQPDIIRQIADQDHEIGYHYEDLSLFKGDKDSAISHFERQLAYFRKFYPVQTICMHGSPTSQYDNKNLWNTYDYHSFGIIGEPYFDIFGYGNKKAVGDIFYLTDTGRMWNGDRFSIRDKVADNQLLDYKTTQELIFAARKDLLPNKLMITTHPQRWSSNYVDWIQEYGMQTAKNLIKWLLIRFLLI